MHTVTGRTEIDEGGATPGRGRTRRAIAEGYIPSTSPGPRPQRESHQTMCLLNAPEQEAHVRLTVFFADRAPVGPYRITLPAGSPLKSSGSSRLS
jgi:hypothetical protein